MSIAQTLFCKLTTVLVGSSISFLKMTMIPRRNSFNHNVISHTSNLQKVGAYLGQIPPHDQKYVSFVMVDDAHSRRICPRCEATRRSVTRMVVLAVLAIYWPFFDSHFERGMNAVRSGSDVSLEQELTSQTPTFADSVS